MEVLTSNSEMVIATIGVVVLISVIAFKVVQSVAKYIYNLK